MLTGRVVGTRPSRVILGDLLPDGTDAATMGAFFAAHGDRVQEFVGSEFESFRAEHGIPQPPPVEAARPERLRGGGCGDHGGSAISLCGPLRWSR